MYQCSEVYRKMARSMFCVVRVDHVFSRMFSSPYYFFFKARKLGSKIVFDRCFLPEEFRREKIGISDHVRPMFLA